MIPNDQPLRKEMIERMLSTFTSSEEEPGLTKWEENFISSIKDQFERKGDLSNRQCEILERIYDKL